MRTSYRELSRREFEISVIAEDDERTVLGVICSDQNGKWFLDQSYFPIGADCDDARMSDSMVTCGRVVVKIWERAETQRKFNERLRKSQLEKEEITSSADDSYYESLWDINSFDPFDEEP